MTDISLEDLSDANRGQVLVEKKGGDTTDKIKEILGYGSKEFSQIVLLPQGKFQDFLLANTGEKLKILSTLFDVSLYAKLSKEFSDDFQAIITRKEDLKNNKIGVLLTKEFNSSEELETSLAHEKNQTKSLSVNAINLKKGFEKVKI